MSTSNVPLLSDFSERRVKRLECTRALFRGDPGRSNLLDHLAVAIDRAEADRAAVLWLDECGPALVHVHCVLDLVSDAPRRKFAVQDCYSSWHCGVPGFVDMPRVGSGRDASFPGGARSTCWVSMGSDGTRAWFLTVDSVTPRAELPVEAVEELMFLAGEAAAVVLHRDLDQQPLKGQSVPRPGDRSNLMTDEKLAGQMSAAIKHGWEAVQLYPTEPDRLRALTDLAWVFVEGGDLGAAEDAYTVVAHRSEDFVYRVYALAVLAYIEALRGDEKSFNARLATLDETSWRTGSPFMISELFLNRGKGYRALGDHDRAVEWLEQAKEFSKENGNDQVTFQAEAELESLRSGDPAGAVTPDLRTPTTLEGVVGVRDGLSVLREELSLV